MTTLVKKANGEQALIGGLEPIKDLYISERPTKMPTVPKDRIIVCMYNQGLDDEYIVCETLEQMQHVSDQYFSGMILDMSWYFGRNVKFRVLF